MSRISDHSSVRRRAGFTLVEVMIAAGLLAIIFAGTLAAYLFLGRSLTRLVNLQHQEVESRRTLRLFTQDVSAASQLSTATSAALVLTKPTASGTTTISYNYSSATGNLVRTEGAASQTLLTGLTTFALSYYSEAGATITSGPQGVKSVELTFASANGTVTSGTEARYQMVSPRVVLRNTPLLQ